MPPSSEQRDIDLAYEALRAMVLDEWPSHRYSLGEIVNTWGPATGVTTEQIEAVRRVEDGKTRRSSDSVDPFALEDDCDADD
jgi:hypothetical protein